MCTESKLNSPWQLSNRKLGMCPYIQVTGIVLTTVSRAVLGHERMEVQARKFYSQRNMYLCGFTLFLSLILNRTYLMVGTPLAPHL